MADAITSIAVGGVERLAQDTHWTGDANSFARDLAGSIVNQGYDLETAWWSTDQVHAPSSGFDFGPVRFSPDGSKLYGRNGGKIHQFNLSRPWDMTAIPGTAVASFALDIFRWWDWSHDGNKLYIHDAFTVITEYPAAIPFEIASISTASAVSLTLERNTYSFQFVKDGKELVTFGTRFQGSDSFLFLEKYLLTDAYNLATAAFAHRSKEWNPSAWHSVEGQFLPFQFAEGGDVGYFLPLDSGSSIYAFHKIEFNTPYDITSIPTSSPLNSSTGDIEIFFDVGIDSTATDHPFNFESFQFMPNGCAVIIENKFTGAESLYRVDLACGGFVPPSSDEAAGDTVASANSKPSAPYINRDPGSFTWLNGNCITIQSTAIGACASEEVVVVKQGGVDYTISSKFLGNDSFCGGLEAHLFDSYGVQNSTATNLITGADHLAGEVVGAWGDGQDLGFYKVSSTGTFTIPIAATSVTYGIPYAAWFKSAKLAYGVEAGNTALTQRKKINHLGFVLYCAHARGLEYGPSTDKLNPMPRIEGGKLVSPDAIWPHYDEETIEFPGEWDTDSRVVLKAQAPRGVTVLAAVMQLDTREKI